MKDSDIVKAYRKVVTSFGLKIDDEDYLVGGKSILKLGKLPTALPTKKHIDTLVDEYGKPVKYLFNPMKESIIDRRKDTTVLLKALNITAEACVKSIFMDLIESVNKDGSEMNIELATFIGGLDKVRKKAKVLVDETTIRLASNIPDKFPLIRLKLKRGIKDKGEKSKMGIIVSSPYLEFLQEGDGQKYTRKHRDFFTYLLEYILADVMGPISKSNHDKHPEINALLSGNLTLYEEMRNLTERLGFELLYHDQDYTYDDIADFDDLYTAIAMIPDTDSGVVEKTILPESMNDKMDSLSVTDTNTPKVRESNVKDLGGEEMISVEEARRLRGDPVEYYRRPTREPMIREPRIGRREHYSYDRYPPVDRGITLGRLPERDPYYDDRYAADRYARSRVPIRDPYYDDAYSRREIPLRREPVRDPYYADDVPWYEDDMVLPV